MTTTFRVAQVAGGGGGNGIFLDITSSVTVSDTRIRSYVYAVTAASEIVVGDQKGRVGYGKGKAKEVPEAIRKATEQAKRKTVKVPLREGRTLHHDIDGRHGAGRVIMRSAKAGTGIIAGGPMRAVFEMLGIQDVVAKSLGSQNPYNMIRATISGLTKEWSPRMVAQRRGKKVSEITFK